MSNDLGLIKYANLSNIQYSDESESLLSDTVDFDNFYVEILEQFEEEKKPERSMGISGSKR